MRFLLYFIPLFLISCGTYKRSENPKYINPSENSANLDSDKDGIRDKFDKCPNTPSGISVNTHGCPKDTDGDGVADYKDKELITPSDCQPSDADGVGDCDR